MDAHIAVSKLYYIIQIVYKMYNFGLRRLYVHVLYDKLWYIKFVECLLALDTVATKSTTISTEFPDAWYQSYNLPEAGSELVKIEQVHIRHGTDINWNKCKPTLP